MKKNEFVLRGHLMCDVPEEHFLKMTAMMQSNMPPTEDCTFNALRKGRPAGKGMTCEQYADKMRHTGTGPDGTSNLRQVLS